MVAGSICTLKQRGSEWVTYNDMVKRWTSERWTSERWTSERWTAGRREGQVFCIKGGECL